MRHPEGWSRDRRFFFTGDGIPSNAVDAVRASVILALLDEAGGDGLGYQSIARAMLWVDEPQYAALWASPGVFGAFKRLRASVPELRHLQSDTTWDLLQGLLGERAATRDEAECYRRGASTPAWAAPSDVIVHLAKALISTLRAAESAGAL